MKILKKILKIIIVFLLVGTLTITSAENARATGAEGVVEIVGGSIAAGGIGAALATICPPAMIILGLVMVGQGIDIALTEASEAEGKTKLEFLQSKFEDFCDATKQDFDTMCNQIALGAKVSELGFIVLSTECCRIIAQFLANMEQTGQIYNVSDIDRVVILGNTNIPVVSPGDILNCYKNEQRKMVGFKNRDASSDYAFFSSIDDDIYYIYALSKKIEFKLQTFLDGTTSFPMETGYGTSVKGIYKRQVAVIDTEQVRENKLPVIDFNSIDNLIRSLNGKLEVVSGTPSEDSFISSGAIDNSVLNPSQGYETVINPGLDIPGLQNGNVGTVGVKDYLDTLGQAINGVQNLTVAVQDLTTGIIDNVNVGAYDVATDVAISQEAEQDIENEVVTPVIDVEAVPTQEAAQQALNGMQFDLTKIFPFCIPFDLVHLVQKFDVTPVAPHVQISVPLPGVGTNFELDIDLSDFDGVARVARMMELVASIVGLAMVTRGLIRG